MTVGDGSDQEPLDAAFVAREGTAFQDKVVAIGERSARRRFDASDVGPVERPCESEKRR